MCGRYAFFTPTQAVARLFDAVDSTAGGLAPRYNIAPTQRVPIVRWSAPDEGDTSASPLRMLSTARWGLVPFWAKDPAIGNRMINARGETVSDKPAFRAAFSRRRCLVPADGFFEWRKSGAGKQPWFIRAADQQPLALAGLWETWSPDGGEPLHTCTIITTAANGFMRPLHDRMPVILDAAGRETWLDRAASSDVLQAVLVPAPDDALEAWPVSRRVNRPANDDPALLDPVPPE